jgi:AAA15 family ATPase/GTPase
MYIKNIHIIDFKGLRDIKIEGCSNINAFLGKNNSGKSSILHAIDIASLAISIQNWDSFQPKLEIKDLINDAGNFKITISYEDGVETVIRTNTGYNPIIENKPTSPFKSILILPDVGFGLLTRTHRTPVWIIQQLEAKNFQNINALEILFAIKFFSDRRERNLTPDDYKSLISEVSNYFPDILNLTSDRTENDIATLTYEEYGKRLDILYSGTGLKHFLDILIKITLSGAKIVLLDEPELGLHPDLQRRFMQYLNELSAKKGIQLFIATHSQVILNYADSIKFFRVVNNSGIRNIISVETDAIHTVLGDLGVKPSDIFNQDICLLVEGATEVIFFEHIIRTLYKDEFKNVAIGIIQYGGGAADGIISGAINISNIVSSQKYLLWLRDRDAAPEFSPSTESTKFQNAIKKFGYNCHIWKKREIEFYYPEIIHEKAQQGDACKEEATRLIYRGAQLRKYRDEAASYSVCVPKGAYLKKLLNDLLKDKSQLDTEVRALIEQDLVSFKNELLG